MIYQAEGKGITFPWHAISCMSEIEFQILFSATFYLYSFVSINGNMFSVLLITEETKFQKYKYMDMRVLL